ncbi:MAG: TetR/AcrR family transcriptional regulator [Clostridiales bacterium]|nr:TetR/AcrR family transcriptional regulator [Clostridiales bacterium]
MEEILKKLDSEKRDRIINSALDEFGHNSYEKASTNNIVKNAGISKGLLFHYFRNKQELYNYLENFVFQKMMDVILEEIDWNESDIFNRIKQIAIIKMEVISKYPGIETFGKVIYEKKSINEIKMMIEKMVPDIYHQIYTKNIDLNRFRDDIDFNKVIQIIQWTFEKYVEEQMELIKKSGVKLDFSKIIFGMDLYIDVMRKAFYKGGEL